MKFYVYTLSYNGEIFYVGKGTKNRMYIHEQRYYKGIKSNNNTSLYEKIKNIVGSGNQIEYTKIYETDDELDAYRIEFETIDSIGIDNLCNLTKDYLRTSVSEMVKSSLKKSEKWKKVLEDKKSKEVREYYRSINTGEKNPRYGKKNTEEHMKAIKNALINVPKSEEHRKKIGDAIRGIKRSEETKSKLSNSLINSEKFQEKVQSEEFKAKHKNNTKNRHEKLITYFFEYNGEEIIHKGGLKNMSLKYDISFNILKKLRYGKIQEYNGWKFIKIINESFVPFKKSKI
jgi:NUMOD3 motif